MTSLVDYLKRGVERGASDLFILAGSPVTVKCGGQLMPAGEDRLLPGDTEELIQEIYRQAGRAMEHFMTAGDDDFSFAVPSLARFRVNAYRQRGSLAAVVRVVEFHIPDYEAIHIPQEVMNVSRILHGLVLVTGTAGSGKSTTQACIIDCINRTREGHIITLEDPIEFLHRNQMCLVSQREISIDTKDYPAALRACLREAPDVILLGEMRDHDTIRTAMTAAETGHLVIATLHTKGAVNSIDRIIDTFSSGQQEQIRVQLSMVLHTVVSQQLLPMSGGGLIPAYEILQVNTAVRNMIRENKTHQIDNVISSGGKEGMISMDQSILQLYKEGKIEERTMMAYAGNPEQIQRKL